MAINQAETHDSTSLNLPTVNSICQELVPRLPSTIRRLLFAPVHSPNLAFTRMIGADQPPPVRQPDHPSTPTSDSTTDDQLKDKLAILYDLVFELRQGVEDLHFRLQLTDEKVAQFLQILSSLSETVLSPPVPAKEGAAPTEDTPMPEAANTGEDKANQSAARSAPERGEKAPWK
jgi:hypothetical protein